MKTAIAGVFAVSVLLISILLASPAYSQSLPPDGPAETPPVEDAANKIDPQLESELQSAQAGDLITVIVTLKEQANLRSIASVERLAPNFKTVASTWFTPRACATEPSERRRPNQGE